MAGMELRAPLIGRKGDVAYSRIESSTSARTLHTGGHPGRWSKLYSRLWPLLLAILFVLVIWQGVYFSGWKPSYVLPSPAAVGQQILTMLGEPRFWQAVATTMTRALIGFGVAVSLGTALGIAVSRFRIVKAAVGSLLTGLQTMPSIAWFPFAILLFGLTEQAILFVVVLGAAPSVANGLISGIGDVSPHLIRAARTMGARGVSLYRFIVLPAALPAYLSGLNQGWAFAWRSLMAGELLVIIASRPSLGVQLAYYRDFANAPALVASMIFILVIGMVVDGVFSRISNAARVRRGLGAVSR